VSFPEFQGCERAITDSDLDAVERRLGINLPLDLRQHYLHFNGGRPVPSFYLFDGGVYKVEKFPPIKYGKQELTFEATYARLVLGNDDFPENLIPFAYDPGGEFFCYSVAKSSFGSIWCTCGDNYAVQDEGPVELAQSLHEFLDKLQSDPYSD